MTLFALLSVIVCLAALFGLVSHRYLRLPPTIGTLALSVVFVSVLTLLGVVVLNERSGATDEVLTHETLPVIRILRLAKRLQRGDFAVDSISEARVFT